MKHSDVKAGQEYQTRIQGTSQRVRIEAARSNGGWDATVLATGKTIRIKSPNLLRKIPEEAVASEASATAPTESAAPTPEPVAATVADEASAVATTEAAPVAAEPPTVPTAGPKRLSAIDAAARALAEAGTPMNTKQMVEAMAAKGYWSSPAGKTPAQTLYSAILREIAAKGDQARFMKTDRGTFAART